MAYLGDLAFSVLSFESVCKEFACFIMSVVLESLESQIFIVLDMQKFMQFCT